MKSIYITSFILSLFLCSCGRSSVDVNSLPTDLKADYRLEQPKVAAADLGIKDKQVLVYDFHNERRNPAVLPLFDEKLLILAMEGMINRFGPLVYIDYTAFGMRWDSIWQSYYSQTQKFEFLKQPYDVNGLIKRLSPVFNGIVLYEPKPSDNYFLAANIANVNFCLPVSRKFYEEHQQAFGKLPVIIYIPANKMQRKQIYDWLVDNLMPLTDLTTAYCASARFPDNQMGPNQWDDYFPGGGDYPFYCKAFIYNISSLQAPSRRVAGGPNPEGGMEGSAESFGVFDKIMKKLKAPAMVFGWGTAEADQSRWGHAMCHSCYASSMSFHAAMKPLYPPPYHQDTTPKIDKPQPKVYLAFVANEGDTASFLTHFRWGAWQDPARGKVPLNWPIPPAYIKRFPAMIEYYVRTKTDKDYFVCPPSGAAYVHADFMKPDDLQRFAQFTADSIKEGLNLREVLLWGSDSKRVFEAYAKIIPDIRGFYPKYMGVNYLGGRLSFTDFGHVPVIREGQGGSYWATRFCDNSGGKYVLNKQKLMDYLNTVYNEMPKPHYLEMYCLESNLPSVILEIQQFIDPNKFEIIDMGTMAHLAAQTPSNADKVPIKKPVGKTLTWTSDLGRNAQAWKGLDGAVVSSTGKGIKIKAAPNADFGWAVLENVVVSPTATRDDDVSNISNRRCLALQFIWLDL